MGFFCGVGYVDSYYVVVSGLWQMQVYILCYVVIDVSGYCFSVWWVICYGNIGQYF